MTECVKLYFFYNIGFVFSFCLCATEPNVRSFCLGRKNCGSPPLKKKDKCTEYRRCRWLRLCTRYLRLQLRFAYILHTILFVMWLLCLFVSRDRFSVFIWDIESVFIMMRVFFFCCVLCPFVFIVWGPWTLFVPVYNCSAAGSAAVCVCVLLTSADYSQSGSVQSTLAHSGNSVSYSQPGPCKYESEQSK